MISAGVNLNRNFIENIFPETGHLRSVWQFIPAEFSGIYVSRKVIFADCESCVDAGIRMTIQ